MKISRIGLTLGLTGLATAALALPPMVKDFATIYKLDKGSKLAQAKCATCHVGMSAKLNPYGQDLKQALADAKTKKITEDVLKKIESQDSDKDGVKNIDEIKADTLPGDPKSKK